MASALSTLLACSLVSCATISVHASDGKSPSSSNGTITRGNGSGPNGSGGGGDGAGDAPNTARNANAWQERVPRTPMWAISCYTGQRNSPVHPSGNDRGIANWWRGDNAVDELINRIQQGYDYGARWFFINRPMGTPGFTDVPAASWLTLEDHKRDELPRKLTDALLDQFDEPVHVVWFIGSDMRDPRDFHGFTDARANEYYGIGENDNWRELISSRVTIGGWLSTGASGIAIDHSAPPNERQHYIELADALGQFPFNLNVYGEAYPLVVENGRTQRDDNNSPIIDTDASSKMPWVAISDYVDRHWPYGSSNVSFPLDTDSTRLFVWMNHSSTFYGNTDEQREERIAQYIDMGLIPITHDPAMFQEALALMGSGSSASNTSRTGNGNNNNSGGSGTTRVVIQPSKMQGARRSVPNQSLPARYQPRSGNGIE